MLLHEDKNFKELIERIASDLNILPQLVEKDYWIMHCLCGLQKQGFEFELKGGTSLSKGFGIIERFSEDIDIKINPSKDEKVYTSRNHDKENHIKSRTDYFNNLASRISIPSIKVDRDHIFDDKDMRSAGIALIYNSFFDKSADLKTGVLLEVGFAITTPNTGKVISSWAFDRAFDSTKNPPWENNKPTEIKCFEPGYTLVEKMEAVCRKHRQYVASGKIEANFMRHYYDIYCLLKNDVVQKFIQTKEYKQYKSSVFGSKYNLNISENEALLLKDKKTFEAFSKLYLQRKSLYYGKFISFEDIIKKTRKESSSL